MFRDLKWDAVERAYKNIQERYSPGDYLVLLIKPSNDGLKKRNITVEHFKSSIWDLYNNHRFIDEIAVVVSKPGADGTAITLFSYSSKRIIDEGMPKTGDGTIVRSWNKLNKERREACMTILESQILEEINARTE